ncbi:hypothetical protein [Desulfitibacter alkalitolerans]|uniref:hypothetical protein n=1 Tax=Desulfitibacter alkalitolerans TaxID=264641 RepID=UPI0012EBC3F0|nr:hypothetical protein [Desulfitibacter alkalitolerans]
MRMILHKLYLLAILILLVLGINSPSPAKNADLEIRASRVIIIDLGGLTIEEIKNYPFYNLRKIIREGSIGLMNTSTAGPRTRENGFITIGSGITSQWGNASPLIYSTSDLYNGEKAGRIYERLVGETPHNGGGVVLDIAQSSKKVRNSEKRHWGRLGNILNENGLSSVFIGNSGYMGLVQNQMALMFMDSTGRIPAAYFDTISEMDLGPLSYISDYNRIHSIFKNSSNASVIGVDLGDWNRLHLVQEMADEKQFQKTKNDIVQLQDSFLSDLIQDLDPNKDLLIILSPAPTREQNRLRNLMVPIILWGKGVEPGLLTSASTRREGIVSNIDILPTIISSLNLDSKHHFIGRPVTSQMVGYETLDYLADMNHTMQFIYNTRPTLVKGYISLQIITLSAAMIMMLFIPRLLLYLRLPLLFLMSIPFGLLLVGLVPTTSLFAYTTTCLFLTLGLLSVSLLLEMLLKTKKYNHSLSPFILIGLFTSAAILIDLYMGAQLIKKSTLGYDPLAGARYYGIGNEFVGVLIGSSIIGISGLLDRFKDNKYVLGISSVYLLVVVYLIASPTWGSNLGGTIAAVVGFSYLIHQLFLERLTIFQVAAAGAFGIACVLSLAVIDSMRDASLQSHFGRTASMVLVEGIQPVYEIIVRKIGMNIKLFRYTIWSRVFLLAMAALIVAFFKPIYLIQKLKASFSQIYHGLYAIILASIAALLVNDSGIVAAATMLIYAVAPLLYLGGRLYNNEKIVQ